MSLNSVEQGVRMALVENPADVVTRNAYRDIMGEKDEPEAVLDAHDQATSELGRVNELQEALASLSENLRGEAKVQALASDPAGWVRVTIPGRREVAGLVSKLIAR